VRKRPIWRVSVIVSLLATALVLVVSGPGYTAGPLDGYSICLDPGHGGTDPGAVYDDGTIYLEEADINLDVAHGLEALLYADGAEVYMTRTDDTYLTNSDRYTYCNGTPSNILVSVHTNSVTESWVDGSYALYFQSDDKILAQAIYDAMYPALRDSAPDPASFADLGLNRYASGVLLKSDMPAAMMEPLFMSNPAEAALLITPIYAGGTPDWNCRRGQIAQAIYDGILSYLSPGSTNAPPTASFTYSCDGLTCQFDASASSDLDGSILAYMWDFGDGSSASGLTMSHTYGTVGTYPVTLSVTDDEGATGTVTRQVTVGNDTGTMHIGDLDGTANVKGKSGKWEALVAVTVHDTAEQPVGGATVSATWDGAPIGSVSGKTDTAGQVTFATGNMDSGASVTFSVDDITHSSLAYDASLNHDPDDDSDGTTITVTR
jgi:N-acetylmuramoyl-L-alanine amidase